MPPHRHSFPSPELRHAFPRTVPIMMGYLFLGFAFGVLLSGKGYGAFYSFLSSLLVYAGSLQFVMIELLTRFDPLQAALVALLVNARHLFYGLTMLERFRGTGRYKPYLIHALTDETYSLYCAGPAPGGLREDRYMFSLSWLNHLYWITGSVLGAAAGQFLPLESTGIEFTMTALFAYIVLRQWDDAHPALRTLGSRLRAHAPALVGVVSSVLCLILFDRDAFLIPAMGVILVSLLLLRPILEGRDAP